MSNSGQQHSSVVQLWEPGLTAAAGTDCGLHRENNEDRYCIDVANKFLLVVDGVGGHAAGEVAANLAVEAIQARLSRQDDKSPEERVREAIVLANQNVLTQAAADPTLQGMACVLTLALYVGKQLVVGHVGDCRMYKLDAKEIRKLTHDHSPVGQMEDRGELSEIDAMRHPRRNEVFKDVGSERRTPHEDDFVELALFPFGGNEAVLMCSDGLSDLVTSIEMHRVARLHAGNPAAVVQALIRAANDAGGTDNITVVYAEGPTFGDNRSAEATLPLPIATESPGPAATREGGEIPETLDPDKNTLTHRLIRRAEPIFKSRTSMLSVGVVIGLLGAFVLSGGLSDDPGPSFGPRQLIVDRNGAGHYATIAAALADARPTDVVVLEPGEYAEQVSLSQDDISLVARLPGEAILIAAASSADWTSLTLNGARNTVRGIAFSGTPTSPIHVAIRSFSRDAEIDDVSLAGSIDVGVEIQQVGPTVLRGSRFSSITGTGVRVGKQASAVVRQNTFVSPLVGGSPALEIAADSSASIRENLFVHFVDIVSLPSAHRDSLLEGNFVVARPKGK